jgi:hypothetical protein
MYCYTVLPLDLHVLGLPLAFILSQDQTLHSIKNLLLFRSYISDLTFFSLVISFASIFQRTYVVNLSSV